MKAQHFSKKQKRASRKLMAQRKNRGWQVYRQEGLKISQMASNKFFRNKV